MKTILRLTKGSVTSAKGFVADGLSCGIKKRGRKDLAVVASEHDANAAGVFTKNVFAAAPVVLSRETLRFGKLRAVVINSGNANACTGDAGDRHARLMQAKCAKVVHVAPERVAVCSTGVIGVPLPIRKIERGLSRMVLERQKGHAAAEAILTTDSFTKERAVTFAIGSQKVTIGGMVKGAGMIEPSMATMIAVVTTDIAITASLLRKALRRAADQSFNRITVDGDESTNDTVLVMANGLARNRLIDHEGAHYRLFVRALMILCQEFAKDIVRDGEGATSLVELSVEKAASSKDALIFARKIANSSLVKTAVYGRDPNWGRIVAALGSVRIPLDLKKIDIYIDDCCLVRHGAEISRNQRRAKKILAKKEIVLRIVLHQGHVTEKIWTCDLTHDYVTINASYRS